MEIWIYLPKPCAIDLSQLCGIKGHVSIFPAKVPSLFHAFSVLADVGHKAYLDWEGEGGGVDLGVFSVV